MSKRKTSKKEAKSAEKLTHNPLFVAVVTAVLTALITVVVTQFAIVRPSADVSSVSVLPGWYVSVSIVKVQCSRAIVHVTFDPPPGSSFDRIGTWTSTVQSHILLGPYDYEPNNVQAAADCAD